MGEYAAFPYQNHKPPEHTRVFHVEARKPLTFHELYSPRGESGAPVRIGACEKLYWRTRDRIAFSFYECRAEKILIITCKDVSLPSGTTFKTILVDLETLYFELDQRKRGIEPPEPLLFKTNKGILTDVELHKAAIDHLLARLNISEEPLCWPVFNEATWSRVNPLQQGMSSSPTPLAGTISSPDGADEKCVVAPKERMLTLSQLALDKAPLEIPIEVLSMLNVNTSGIEHLKVKPSVPGCTGENHPLRAPQNDSIASPVGARNPAIAPIESSPIKAAITKENCCEEDEAPPDVVRSKPKTRTPTPSPGAGKASKGPAKDQGKGRTVIPK